jgi:hypothetical protein
MHKQRPTSVLVIAILNIIFGSLGLLGGLCGLGQEAMGSSLRPGNPAAADPQKLLEKEMPGYKIYMLASHCVGLIAGSVLLASGIGLLQMHVWARNLAMGYAVYLLIAAVVNVAIAFVWVMPAMQRFETEFNRALGGRSALPSGSFGAIMILSTMAVAALQVGYAAAILFFLTRPHVRLAFAGGAPASSPEEDYDRRFRY